MSSEKNIQLFEYILTCGHHSDNHYNYHQHCDHYFSAQVHLLIYFRQITNRLVPFAVPNNLSY
jgi:hypothetical protein